jgi:N utilization substance protein B
MEVLDDFVVHQDARGPSVDFARALIAGILETWERLNSVIGAMAKNWALRRMATTDRNILRLGCYELLCKPETPAGVVINEAVELAKKYGTSNSGAFVNGILDRIRNRRDEGEDLLALPESPPEP